MILRRHTRVSVITPVFNTEPRVLTMCIESVRAQDYYDWELCLCDDSSTDRATVEVLRRYQGIDPRIRVARTASNLHLAGASNAAAEFATGEVLAFLDHDDVLAPNALGAVARAAANFPDIDLLYTDEDIIDEAGRLCDPYFKPDWSPEHLMSVMYISHLLVVRKSLFLKLGGFRKDFSGAQDYDLALRASRLARRVHHIPEVLYHRRKVAGTASADVEAKPFALAAARRALEDHLAYLGEGFEVRDGLLPDTFRVRPPIPEGTPVTLLILTNDSSRILDDGRRINLVRHSIRSIVEKSTYPHYRLLVVDSGNTSAETKQAITRAAGRLVSAPPKEPFCFPANLNFGMSHVDTEQVIILNDDIEVITPDWIESLIEWTCQPSVGAAGARLLYPDNTLQHSGIALGEPFVATHAFYKLPAHSVGYYGYTHLVRNSSAVTGAVLATRASAFREVGGFDALFATDFNDVDYCLRLGLAGFRVVFTPYCELYHLEGSSLRRTSQNPKEVNLFRSRWRAMLRRDSVLNYQAIRRHHPNLI